jgi:hypothetical protein
VITYLLNNNLFTKEEAEQWEKDVFEDTVDKFNSGTLDFEYYLGESIQNS